MPRFGLVVAAGGARELLRRPVAVAPIPGGRPVVGEVSAAAEAFAVAPGLTVGEAFARCPELKLVPPDPAAARAAWEQVVRALEGIGAEVECDLDAPGTAFFEAGGLLRLHGGLGGVLAAARAAVGRPLRIGVARTRFVALAAARAARPRKARVVGTDLERREFLAGAPVDWLGVCGAHAVGFAVGTRSLIGRESGFAARHGSAGATELAELAATLRKLGIETLGEFALLRRAEVAERFGSTGLLARDLVHGREPPLRPRRPAEALVERIELTDDGAGQAGVGCDGGGGPTSGALAADLERALALLVERSLARPERRGRTLRGFTLSARFSEGGSWTTRAVMREPTADGGRIKLALLPKLLELPEPAVAIELAVDAFGPADHEPVTLFGGDPARERAQRLKHAAEQARLAARDPGKVARVVVLDADSRLPERRAALSPGPTPLARPRPIDLRADEDGRPVVVARRRRGGAYGDGLRRGGDRDDAGRVRRLAGHERVPVVAERERWVVEDRWWTGRPVRRRYFELVLADGSNVVVFQDLASRRWYEQRS